jgi:hypothetical protein
MARCGIIHISDIVRSCIIKSLITVSKYYKPEAIIYSCSFSVCGWETNISKIGNELTLQDIVDSQWTSLSLPSTESNNPTYCLSPYGHEIAVVEEEILLKKRNQK